MRNHQQILDASIALAVGEALGLKFWNHSPTAKEITDYYFSNDEIEFSNATYLYLSSLSSMIDTTNNYPGTSDVDWWKAVYDNALLFFLSWNDEFEYYQLKKDSWDDYKKLMVHSQVNYYFERFVIDGRGLNFGKCENNLVLFRALPFFFSSIELDQNNFKRFIYQTHQNENSVYNSIDLINILNEDRQFLKSDTAKFEGFSFVECLAISNDSAISSTNLEQLLINSIRPDGDNAGSTALSFFMWSLNHEVPIAEMERLANRLTPKSRAFLTQVVGC